MCFMEILEVLPIIYVSLPSSTLPLVYFTPKGIMVQEKNMNIIFNIIWTYFVNPSQNMLRPMYEIKQSRTFMESLLADFVPFSCATVKFLFLEKTMDSRLNFEIFLEISLSYDLSLKSLGNSWANSHFQLLVIMIYLQFTCGEWKLYQNMKNSLWEIAARAKACIL